MSKEILEDALNAYTGTVLYVSHDRYFIRQVADALLIIEEDGVMYYPFGYEHYLERRQGIKVPVPRPRSGRRMRR